MYHDSQAWLDAQKSLRGAISSQVRDAARRRALARFCACKRGAVSLREVEPRDLTELATRIRRADPVRLAAAIDAHIAMERTWLAKWDDRLWRECWRTLAQEYPERVDVLTGGDPWVVCDLEPRDLRAFALEWAVDVPEHVESVERAREVCGV